jgi:ankyrin repeat protein
MAADDHAADAEGSKAMNGVGNNGRAEELEGVWSRAMNIVVNTWGTMKNIGAGITHGAQVMPNPLSSQPRTLPMFRYPEYKSTDGKQFGLSKRSVTREAQTFTADRSREDTEEWLAIPGSSLLFSHHIDVNIRDSDDQTPLHFAASNALVDATRAIIQQGADIDSRDNNGSTPLHRAIINYPLANDEGLNVMKLLLDHGAEIGAQDNQNSTPLHLAVAIDKGAPMVVQLLLKYGASIHARNKNSSTPLHCASHYGHPDLIQLLLEHGADIEARDCDGNTPLHLAASQGKVVAAQKLLEHGASIRGWDKHSSTPLHSAWRHGHQDVGNQEVEFEGRGRGRARQVISGGAGKHNDWYSELYTTHLRWCE